jgi:hypothetical protein
LVFTRIITTETFGTRIAILPSQEVRSGNKVRVAPQEFIEVSEAALTVRVFFSGNIDESRAGELSRSVLIAEKPAEVGVFEGIVVREGDFIDVVTINELLPRRTVGSVPPSHHAAVNILSQ